MEFRLYNVNNEYLILHIIYFVKVLILPIFSGEQIPFNRFFKVKPVEQMYAISIELLALHGDISGCSSLRYD